MNYLIRIFFIFILISSEKLFLQTKSQDSYSNILLEEIIRHPHSTVEDIYKFIHQGAFGSEHAVKDTAAAKKWLETEAAELNFSIKDNLFDYLTEDGTIVRVNLRPYINNNYDLNTLFDAFIKTANTYNGSIKKFKSYWKSAEALAKSGKLSVTLSELKSFYKLQEEKGFPAIHHSQLYKSKYKPAYRVVNLQHLPFLKK